MDAQVQQASERIKKLSPKRYQLLELASKHPESSSADLARLLDIDNPHTIAQYFSKIYSQLFGLDEVPRSQKRGVAIKAFRIANREIDTLPQRAAVPAANGHGPVPRSEERLPLPLLPALAGYGVGASVHLSDPQSIVGLDQVTLGDQAGLTERIGLGYQPEEIIEYQSLSEPSVVIAYVLLVRRRKSAK